eukprot:TRINITY_DN6282_c0_g1_i1.p1 TRINITY_DN6282_c0_g1~~TRINITY_DN6282_c0_g1_i1.p1  ORF type:complete len:339 (-),score=39.41 TRINITY_DN6282_c0_g1_i1:102-1118(-)
MSTQKKTDSKPFTIFLTVSFYIVISISVVLLNKYLFCGQLGIDAPLFLTWTQFVITTLVFLVLNPFRIWIPLIPKFEYHLSTAIEVLPLTLLFLGMISFNNLCLKYVEVTFYQVARALTIVFNIIITSFDPKESISLRALLACAVVVVGYVIGCDGEVNFSWRGVIFGVLSSLFVCLYSIAVKKIVSRMGNNEWRVMLYNNVNASLLMPILFYCFGECEIVSKAPSIHMPIFWVVIFISGLFGFLINVATFLQIKLTTALTHNVSGTAKACLQTIIGALIYHNPVSLSTIFGTFMSIFGCAWYSTIRYSEMRIDSPLQKSETQSLSSAPPHTDPQKAS